MTWRQNVEVLLLDMNGTFMFNEDRFGDGENYHTTFKRLGGSLSANTVNSLIDRTITYLDRLYVEPSYRFSFPTLVDAAQHCAGEQIGSHDIARVADVIALHELGVVPPTYAAAIRQLARHFRLGLVADIWGSPTYWLGCLSQAGVLSSFQAVSFSSDIGCVKPAPDGFLRTMAACNGAADTTVVVGDSIRRDLGGANTARLPCILVGGAKHAAAAAMFPDFIRFTQSMLPKTKQPKPSKVLSFDRHIPPTIEIRRSRRDELPLFCQLDQQLDVADYIVESSHQDHLNSFDDPQTVYLTIVRNRRPAGYFVICLEDMEQRVEFKRVVVDEKHRGIGQNAILQMEEFCKSELGVSRIWLDVFDFNQRAQHIYTKLNYRKFGERISGNRMLFLYQKQL